MDIYLRSNPNDCRWTLLVRAVDMPQAVLAQPITSISLDEAEDLFNLVRTYQLNEAAKLLELSEPMQFIESSNLGIKNKIKVLHKVTYHESMKNGLNSQEAMYGLGFTFRNRSHSAMFKLRYANGMNGVKEFALRKRS